MTTRSFAKLAALCAIFALVAGPALAFPCYCNGTYIGDYDDIMSCYNDCEAALQLETADLGLPTLAFLDEEAPVSCSDAE